MRRPRLKPQQYPYFAQREYSFRFLSMLRSLNGRLLAEWSKVKPRLILERNIELGFRVDSYLDTLKELLERMEGVSAESADDLIKTLPGLASSIERFKKRTAPTGNRALASIAFGDFLLGTSPGTGSIIQNDPLFSQNLFGVDIFANNANLVDDLTQWQQANAKLIKDVTFQQASRINEIVLNGVRGGLSSKEIRAQIKATTGLAQRRAKLIADDQVGKLNADIDRKQQLELGVEEYTWRTGQDERVRPSHRVLDGKICRWDNPNVYREKGSKTWKSRAAIGGELQHPGKAIRCRCMPIAILPEL
jgi:SPP1 gp7 family putative phage head morphogenesis protein